MAYMVKDLVGTPSPGYVSKMKKCTDCPAMIKGVRGGGRCKPCQADFQERYQRERIKKRG